MRGTIGGGVVGATLRRDGREKGNGERERERERVRESGEEGAGKAAGRRGARERKKRQRPRLSEREERRRRTGGGRDEGGREGEKGRALVHVEIARPLTILCYYACPFLLSGLHSCAFKPSAAILERRIEKEKARGGGRERRVARYPSMESIGIANRLIGGTNDAIYLGDRSFGNAIAISVMNASSSAPTGANASQRAGYRVYVIANK